MIQRLAHVTTGYLKFTLMVLAGGSLIFFLAGMAMAEPKVCVVTIFLLIAATLVVRMEVKSFRRPAYAPSDSKIDANLVRTIAEIIAIGGAAQTILGSQRIGNDVRKILITEWVSNVTTADETFEALLIQSIDKYFPDLRKQGIQFLIATRGAPDKLIEGMRTKNSGVSSLSFRPDPTTGRLFITIVFAIWKDTPQWDYLRQIKDALQGTLDFKNAFFTEKLF